ncbi:MAG: hypothetical protein M0R03_08110 [Novosphingobium sp.]|nr:hypothetical protein [Novosphingobium sp.]
MLDFGEDKIIKKNKAKAVKNKFDKIDKASIAFQRESSVTKLESLADFNNVFEGRIKTSFSKLADMATKLYRTNGTFADIVDKLSTLLSSGITVCSTGDEEIDKKYMAFTKYFNYGRQTTTRGLEFFITSILTEYAKVGNVFSYYDKNVTLKDGYIHILNQETGDFDYVDVDEIKIPQYGILNPTKCEIDEDKADEYVLELKYDNSKFKKDFTHIAKKTDYEIYGSMLFLRLSLSLYQLILADVVSSSTIDGLIKVITLLKIPTELADDAEQIITDFKEAKRANMPLAVNKEVDLDIKVAKGEYVDIQKLKQDAKRSTYNNAGLSLPMMTGEGDVDREVFNSYVLNLIAFVEKEQNVFLPFIESIFDKFAEINKIPIKPKIVIDKNIFNLLLFDKYFLQMYDRGVLSGLDVLKGTGFNKEQTIFNMSESKKLKEKYGFGIPNDTGYYGTENNNPDILKNPDDDENKGNEGDTKDVRR